VSPREWAERYLLGVPWFIGMAIGGLSGSLGLLLPLNILSQIIAATSMMPFFYMLYALLNAMVSKRGRP
jgi:hypothetical protein